MEWWNIGMMVFKGMQLFFNIFKFPVKMNVSQTPILRFPKTLYSSIPTFHL